MSMESVLTDSNLHKASGAVSFYDAVVVGKSAEGMLS
jgi:hypothetical protein